MVLWVWIMFDGSLYSVWELMFIRFEIMLVRYCLMYIIYNLVFFCLVYYSSHMKYVNYIKYHRKCVIYHNVLIIS